ncbi:MAG: hypothetical protein JWN83_1163 [Chitinophagaceae bacterium]|nr:hypothetical protein [Chitinophagaceae bacterium]
MKLFIKLLLFFLLPTAYFLSCQKQFLCLDCDINKFPVAIAGADQTITLPTDSILLNGNSSFDPDGTIVAYQWTKISGSSSFNITNSTNVLAKADHLVKGVYQFELKVTDNGGLSSKDTIQITVNTITQSGNIPPVARAGNDTIIQTNQTLCSGVTISITLRGTSSFDPDGFITSYLWTGKGNILNPGAPITQVSNLATGINMFILKVTDNNGATGMDTVLVNVISTVSRPVIPVRLIPIGALSQARSKIAVAAAGTKILFAGGWLSPGNNSPSTSRIDIYDVVTNAWSTAELSEGRFGIGSAVLGDKIFFAGGGVQQNNGLGEWQYSGVSSSAVDIYDASSNTWTRAQLGSERSPVGASAGNKVVFAGGDNNYPSARIDIYDAVTNVWSTSSLSEPRHISQAATAGNKIFFAGGGVGIHSGSGGHLSKRIDIYDASSNTVSFDSLNMERGEMGAISANNKIYWAGGILWDATINDYGVTGSVEIKNIATNSTSFECLSEAKDGITAVRKDNKLIFFGGSYYGVFKARFDIYDLDTNLWSIGELPQNLVLASIISYNNTIYIAGGEVNGVISSQVWKLDF